MEGRAYFAQPGVISVDRVITLKAELRFPSIRACEELAGIYTF